jgi:hypothetical protein
VLTKISSSGLPKQILRGSFSGSFAWSSFAITVLHTLALLGALYFFGLPMWFLHLNMRCEAINASGQSMNLAAECNDFGFDHGFFLVTKRCLVNRATTF